MKHSGKILIYGIGNVGRQDDGLGWAFIDAIEKDLPKNFIPYRNYQLQIEDADFISTFDHVLFVDATKDNTISDFSLKKRCPKEELSFTSHALSIEAVMALCDKVYSRTPFVFSLEIRGYAWELQEGLTEKARKNLQGTIHYYYYSFLPSLS